MLGSAAGLRLAADAPIVPNVSLDKCIICGKRVDTAGCCRWWKEERRL